MPVKGYESYFICGQQLVSWDEQCAAIVETIYEFASSGLRNESTPVKPTRFKRNASPAANIETFVSALGDIELNLHADDLVWVFQYLLNDDTVGSSDFTAQEVYGDAGGGGKAFSSPFSLDTQPNATTPTSHPGLLILDLDSSDSGVVTIVGTDQNDMAISEVVTFVAVDTMTTTKYFKTVNVTGISYTGLAVATTMYIEADKNTWTHTIELKDDLLYGLTMEVVKGGLPSVYIGAMINSGVLSIADVIGFTVNFLAKRGWNHYKILVSEEAPTDSEDPTDVSAYSSVGDVFMPAWGMALTIDGAATPTDINGATMTVSNQLAHPDRYYGGRERRQPRRSDNRDISLACGIDYDAAQNDWDEWFYYNQEVAAVLECYSKPAEGPEQKVKFTMPRCQIGAFPDPAVSDYADIVQDILLQPIRTVGATTSDELAVELVCVAAS